jgi:hypothetical protein
MAALDSPCAVPGQRHIPIPRAAIVDACATDPSLDDAERARFGQVCDLLTALYHHRFHQRLEALKDAYRPFDPDTSFLIPALTGAEMESSSQRLVDELRRLLDDANFEELDRIELDRALEEETLLRVRLEVEFEDFEEVLFFARGAEHRQEVLREWFGMKKRTLEFTNYERVLIYVKVRGADYFDDDRIGELPYAPGSTIVKLFRDVPQADLESLFPNTSVRMRNIDQLTIGIPAVVGGVAILFTKLLTSLGLLFLFLSAWLGLRDEEPHIDQAALIALGIGLGSLGGFLWRQISKFKSRKIRFMQQLSEHLYFKNLDNGGGVFFHLVDEAEEEETKEAVLAYWTLVTRDDPLTIVEIDAHVESWMRGRFDHDFDFEEQDAVDKLVELELVRPVGPTTRSPQDTRYEPVGITDALALLDARWDAIFPYAQ